MWGNSSASALAARFARLVEQLGGDTAAAKAMGQQRDLLAAVAKAEPATLGEVAAAVKRGAPAISRAIDALVRAGLVERQPDPDNRRRLALRLTDAGREAMARPAVAEGGLDARLAKLAHERTARPRTRDRNPRTPAALGPRLPPPRLPALLCRGRAVPRCGWTLPALAPPLPQRLVVALPRPEPDFLPPPSLALTVAQARASASSLADTPRSS